jgi:quinol monooxygenase YgiN
MAITALLHLRVRPDALDAAPAVIAAVLAQTRAFEGNLGVEVVEDVAEPGHFVAIEHWDTIEHDDAYRAWRATPAGASDLGSLVSEAPTLGRYTARDDI